ncbi:MAG: homoserine kinase [Chlorobi bacterium]|nr:homoserine kinase [Chlorobiota bacterium]
MSLKALPVTRVEIEEILLHYPAGKLKKFSLPKQGYANTNIFIVTDSGKYILRLYRNQILENILLEIKLLELLSRYHFPSPHPLTDREGHIIWHTSRFPAVLFPWFPGRHPLRPGKYASQVALILAGLHNVKEYKLFRKQPAVTTERCLNLPGDPEIIKNTDPGIIGLFRKTYGKVEKYLKLPLPQGIVHGDLFPDNILVHRGTVSAILDFENYFTGPVLYDIAMTINGFCVKKGFYHNKLINGFLRAYQSVRKMSEEEHQLLPVYIGWAAISMAAWHLQNPAKRDRDRQKKRIRELLIRAEQWLKMPENRF